MTISRFHVCCRLCFAIFVVWGGVGNNLANASEPFNVGDSVTTIKDTDIKSQNRVLGTLSAGMTVTVKKVDGSLALVDADIVGWVPVESVIPLDKAAPYFTALVNHAPNDPHNYYFRAGVWQTQGKYDLAINDYGAAIRLDPKQAAYYTERGNCFLAKKDFAQAIADFTETLKLQPNTAGAYLGRGGVYCETGEYEKAIADWKTAIRLEPNSVVPRSCLVELLACCPEARFRRGELAVKFATALCEETDWQDSQTLHYLACAYAESSDFESAIKWEKQAIALNPPDRHGYLANFQKALATFETHKPVHEFMAFIR